MAGAAAAAAATVVVLKKNISTEELEEKIEETIPPESECIISGTLGRQVLR